MKAQSQLAALIRRARLIVWDEAPMMHRYQLEALDLTLRDVMKTVDPNLEKKPFGLWRQGRRARGRLSADAACAEEASRAQILDAALTRADCWGKFTIFRLSENMRVANAIGDRSELEAFAAWLLRLGEGALDHDADDSITLEPEMCMEEGADLDALVNWVFPDLASRCQARDGAWLAERAILAPLNARVDKINDAISEAFPGDAWECASADATVESDDALAVPTELLNTFDVSGMPKHKLNLKAYMPVMLLRNLNPRAGLCNGTRLLVHEVINGRLLKAEIASGMPVDQGGHRGNIVYIPRITLYPEEGAFPFEWCRRQFPVRVAFAMSINKSQGQTLARVGVDLTDGCFTHGQLYVAASRVGNAAHLRFAVEPNEDGDFRTRNVVFREALTTTSADAPADAPVAAPQRADGDDSNANPEDFL